MIGENFETVDLALVFLFHFETKIDDLFAERYQVNGCRG